MEWLIAWHTPECVWFFYVLFFCAEAHVLVSLCVSTCVYLCVCVFSQLELISKREKLSEWLWGNCPQLHIQTRCLPKIRRGWDLHSRRPLQTESKPSENSGGTCGRSHVYARVEGFPVVLKKQNYAVSLFSQGNQGFQHAWVLFPYATTLNTFGRHVLKSCEYGVLQFLRMCETLWLHLSKWVFHAAFLLNQADGKPNVI